MDNLTYLREAARRDLQLAINELDKARAAEDEDQNFHDKMALVRYIVASQTLKDYGDAVVVAAAQQRTE